MCIIDELILARPLSDRPDIADKRAGLAVEEFERGGRITAVCQDVIVGKRNAGLSDQCFVAVVELDQFEVFRKVAERDANGVFQQLLVTGEDAVVADLYILSDDGAISQWVVRRGRRTAGVRSARSRDAEQKETSECLDGCVHDKRY